MMFQSLLLCGRSEVYDQYRDWRLDVDNMTYEELLELGGKIGYVNTSLREDEIFHCLRKIKHSFMEDLQSHIPTETDWKCSICQEEYVVDDEVGKLDCGHSYHLFCIKQWLLQKNACPVCKAAAAAILRLEIIQEYDADNEMGKLDYSQSYHMFCLKQWLLECLPGSHAAKCQLNIKIDFI
ncbi:PREDICTED: E3 ubiquitin-protein ligase MBR2-like [Nelumbo nucifera]|nr:PREDICTED: E3 ubiquitin-protein ligase MBR2-like [Nelumbo nucifera]